MVFAMGLAHDIKHGLAHGFDKNEAELPMDKLLGRCATGVGQVVATLDHGEQGKVTGV